MLRAINLKTEYLYNPMGLDIEKPRLFWNADGKGMQKAYEIEYLSFCYQMGILGFVVFVGGVLLIYIRKIVKYARKNTWVIKVFTLIGLGWFVIRPAFNPAFLGLQNGFQMIGLLMLNMYFNKKQEPYQK